MCEAITAISVVIPLYNKEQTVLRAIGSVVGQLKDGDEVIVVDDGSTDGGADAVESRYQDSPLVFLVRQQNQGVSGARNEGIRHARHEHVILLDADDWWLQGMRDRVRELIRRWPNAYAWSVGHYRVDGAKRTLINSGLIEDSLLERSDFVVQYAKFSGVINSSTVCVRKKAFFAMGGFPVDATSGEDVYVWLTLGLAGGIAMSPTPLVCIERSLSLEPEGKGRDAVGFHYVYYCDPENFEVLDENARTAVKQFLIRNGVRQIAGSVAGGDRLSGWQKAKAIGRVVPWFPWFSAALLVIPRAVLVWAFRRRHGIS